jgi:hypothetical protein
LSNEDQSVLADYGPSSGSAEKAYEVVVQALNNLIAGPCIYSEDRFKGIIVRGEANALMHQLPEGSMLARLNRVLLEDAYPVELSRNLKAGRPTIRIGDPVVLTIAFTNMSTNETFYVANAYQIVNDLRYAFELVTPSGRKLTPKGSFRAVSGQQGYSLDPSRSTQLAFSYNLSAICNFDEIGIYRVVATRFVVSKVVEYGGVTGEVGFTVVSNPLSITIVSDK